MIMFNIDLNMREQNVTPENIYLCPDFRKIILDQKLMYLLNAGGDIIRAVGKYC